MHKKSEKLHQNVYFRINTATNLPPAPPTTLYVIHFTVNNQQYTTTPQPYPPSWTNIFSLPFKTTVNGTLKTMTGDTLGTFNICLPLKKHNQTITLSTKVVLHVTTRPFPCESIAINSNLTILQTWTQRADFELIYTSNSVTYSAASLNTSITGLDHIMMVVETTNGDVFGAFTELPMPCPPRAGEYFLFQCDPGHFVFILKSGGTTEPKRYRPTDMEKAESFMMYSNEEYLFVATFFRFFILGNHQKKSVILPDFYSFYEDFEDSSPVLKNILPTYFEPAKVFVIRWFD
ncbi:TLDc domain-containing protein [Entamoeba marina]